MYNQNQNFNYNSNEYFRSYMPDMYNTYSYEMANMSYPDYYKGQYSFQDNNYNQMINRNNEELYPEIYKIVYPMVIKICSNNTRAITKDLVDDMTETIYSNIESEDFFEDDVRKEPELKKGDVRNPNAKPMVIESKEDRQKRTNPALKSLIKILILRELLGNPNCCGNRPPRPPFRPGDNYPPFMPREYYQDWY